MILVVDNYDSFTYNLVQLLWGRGLEVEVLRNDVDSAPRMLARNPAAIVISPGPGRPEEAGVCLDLMALEPSMPVLGVCLGHQILGVAYGARVGRARELVHGKTSNIRHLDRGILRGLPNPFPATRYHSLHVEEASLPEVLVPDAWSEDGTLMAMHHAERPYWGVQFHPESILSASGPELVANFLKLCHGT